MDLSVNSKHRILNTEAPLRNLVLTSRHETISDSVLVFTDLLHFRRFENKSGISASFDAVESSGLRSQVELESFAPNLLLTLLEVDMTLAFNVLCQVVPPNLVRLQQHVLIAHLHFTSSTEVMFANTLLFD